MSNFPAGLRVVVVVDDDFTCLSLLEELLRACQYQVTKCQRAADALSLLRGDRYGFDIVLTDIFMPEMDGFQLLEIIRLEMDYLPVVMMSSDERKDVVLKAVNMGACDYLMKPVRMQEISVIWQHVVRKQRNDLHSLILMSKSNQNPGNAGGDEYRNGSRSPTENCASSTQERREEELQEVHKNDILSMKKPRMIWTPELHQQFVAAVNHIGLANAVPKKILEHMKVAGLTRENVASHLQKYRLFLRRKKEASLVHHYQDAHPASTVLHGQVYVSPTQFPSQTSTPTHAERLGVSSSIYHGCGYNQTFSEPSMIQAIHQENCQGIQQIDREQPFDEYATYTIPMPCTTMIEVKQDHVTKSAGTYECTFQESQPLEDQSANMNFYLCTSYEHPFFCSTS